MQLRNFLKVYTAYQNYKNNLIIGSDRIDLEGNITTQITEEEIAGNIKPPEQPQPPKETAVEG